MEEGKKTVNFEEKIPHYSQKGIGDKFKNVFIAFVVIAVVAVVAMNSTYPTISTQPGMIVSLRYSRISGYSRYFEYESIGFTAG